MDKEFLIKILGIVSVGHVRLITGRAVEMLHSLLRDGNPKMASETVLTHCVSTPRHDDHLWEREMRGQREVT